MDEPKSSGIRVTIFGTEYPIKGDADPAYIKEVADYVDQKMRNIAKNAPMQSSLKVAILAALNIADELFKARTGKDKLLSELETKIDDLIDSIDQEFIDD
jgi:cell division protein ZapA